MQNAILEDLASAARQASISTCWSQWVALGSSASPASDHRARAIVDPEALVLLSLWAQGYERRLLDLVGWWAEVGSHLTSVNRLRTISRRFPGQSSQLFSTFARLAYEAGDRRWASHASSVDTVSYRPGKGPKHLKLAEPSTLMVRMRAGFGVGTKADVLTFLLGARGARATVSVLSRATAYSGTAVRSASQDMALARLIRESSNRPSYYFLPAKPWAELLELQPYGSGSRDAFEIPEWRFWSDLFAFLAAVDDWTTRVTRASANPHIVASQARDLFEAHSEAFALNGIPTPSPEDFPGQLFVEGLLETVRVVADWLRDHL